MKHSKLKNIVILLLLIVSICKFSFATAYSGANVNNEVINRIMTMKMATEYKDTSYIDELDTVTFGNYTQNPDEHNAYRKDPVEWILLYRDGENALLMSKYILECKAYNDEEPKYENHGFGRYGYYVPTGRYDKYMCDWEASTLRKWMNENMYNELFNESEKSIINTAYLDNTYVFDYEHYTVHGNYTKDNVFILSEDEMFHYLGKNNSADYFNIKATRASEYIKINSNINVQYDNVWHKRNSAYFLRTKGNLDPHITAITSGGTVRQNVLICDNTYGIRPCIFVKLKSTNDMARMNLSDEPRKNLELGLSLDLYESIKLGHWINDNGINCDLDWYVIKKEDNKALVLCKNAVKRLAYYKQKTMFSSWEDSQVRSFLSNDFYNNAFDESEKNRIISSNIKISGNPNIKGGSISYSMDSVFILSYEDIVECIGLENKNILIGKTFENEDAAWYIRNPGENTNSVCSVLPSGNIDLKGKPANASRYVRPAMWISISN